MSGMKLKVQRGFKAGTRIQSIEVPDALRVRHTSGIDWVDDALGGAGGFAPTSCMMLTGGPGTGKSTLLRQLANSLTKVGHIVVLNSGEESLVQCKMACERLNCDEDFMVAEETMLPTLLTFMDNVKAGNPGKQVFLLQDSLSTIDDGKYIDKDGNSRGTTSKTPGYCTEMLVDWCQSSANGSYGVCIFICQVNKGGDFSGQNKIRHAIDIHGELWVDVKERSETYGDLLFEVSKNRWGSANRTTILKLEKTGLSELGNFPKAGS